MKSMWPLLVSGPGLRTKLATKEHLACSSTGVDKCSDCKL